MFCSYKVWNNVFYQIFLWKRPIPEVDQNLMLLCFQSKKILEILGSHQDYGFFLTFCQDLEFYRFRGNIWPRNGKVQENLAKRKSQSTVLRGCRH